MKSYNQYQNDFVKIFFTEILLMLCQDSYQ